MAIATVLDAVGAGIGPARAVTSAWQTMSLPQWQGRAASSWDSLVSRETARTATAPTAFTRTATALSRYQTAFVAARAEIEAAIQHAAAAEHATATAKQQHHEATRKAATADPGTPHATVAPFIDPGATTLANAQARAQAALTSFNQAGNEVASEIRAAAGGTSNEKSGIEWWDQILQFPGQFIQGAAAQVWDTVVGVWEMLPVKYIIDNLVNPESKPWWEAYFGDLWGGMIGAIVEDPWGAIQAIWSDFIAADHWDGYLGEGVGRVTTNVLLL
ncbi:putative T7SS-secreted protein, partial [Rathayibacter toxicus]